MRYGLKYVEEDEVLFGDGTGNHLMGIVPQASLYAPAFAVEHQSDCVGGVSGICASNKRCPRYT